MTCIKIFLVALFVLAKNWKQLRSPSIDEWRNNLRYANAKTIKDCPKIFKKLLPQISCHVHCCLHNGYSFFNKIQLSLLPESSLSYPLSTTPGWSLWSCLVSLLYLCLLMGCRHFQMLINHFRFPGIIAKRHFSVSLAVKCNCAIDLQPMELKWKWHVTLSVLSLKDFSSGILHPLCPRLSNVFRKGWSHQMKGFSMLSELAKATDLSTRNSSWNY